MKFQALCKDLGFEEIPGTNTWAPDGSSVSAVGGGQKRCCRERGRMIASVPAPAVFLGETISQGQIAWVLKFSFNHCFGKLGSKIHWSMGTVTIERYSEVSLCQGLKCF